MGRNSLKSVMRLIDEAKEELPVEQSFLENLKRSIELAESRNKREPSKTYKPSGMNCIRQSYYQITGAKRDETPTSYGLIGICNSGTDIHRRIQGYVCGMKENGIDCEYINVADFVRQRGLDYLTIVQEPNFDAGDYETKLYHKALNLSFLCDGIIRYQNHYYILELKTEYSGKFFARVGVDPSHFQQATAYSAAFGIDEVLFVYINRDTMDMKSFLFAVTDEMKQSLVDYIEECDLYIQRAVIPPKPEAVTKKTCSYCEYRSQCGKDGD